MEEMKQILERILAEFKATPPKMEAEMMAKWDSHLGEATEACEEKMEACLEKEKPAPAETEAVAEPKEVPEGATGEETIGATEERSKDLHLLIPSSLIIYV
jgi:hypothetical protein